MSRRRMLHFVLFVGVFLHNMTVNANHFPAEVSPPCPLSSRPNPASSSSAAASSAAASPIT
ncbi:exported hypothetical protein [Cupriavidus necator]|uniref:Uncharacterized protein n=1 Tax=Cupriavidus necator TaxID=106590 RepID=A0A1K0JS27_CUPNE|nr:exported hypothetical protein [Cupriavidus necator]